MEKRKYTKKIIKFQTVVEWLQESLSHILTDEQQTEVEGLFQQAIEMEKEQIIKAVDANYNFDYKGLSSFGQIYYEELYKIHYHINYFKENKLWNKNMKFPKWKQIK